MRTTMFAIMLAVSALAGSAGAEPLPVKDVPAGHWAAAAVEASLRSRILEGYDGAFHGEKLLNRYQLAVVVRRLLEHIAPERRDDVAAAARSQPAFSDVARTHWAYEAVQVVTRLGIMEGER